MTRADKFEQVFGYRPATDEIICNENDWCGKNDACNYCICNSENIGRAEDWWNAEYKEPTTKNDLGVDAISRQALLNATVKKSSIWNHITNSEGDNLETIVSKLPSVTPQEPKWIFVNERLPEEPKVGKEYRDPSESVLVQLSNGEMKVSRYWSHMNSIHTNLNNWIDLYSFEKVVAWQPLPKPYKESEGQE